MSARQSRRFSPTPRLGAAKKGPLVIRPPVAISLRIVIGSQRKSFDQLRTLPTGDSADRKPVERPPGLSRLQGETPGAFRCIPLTNVIRSETKNAVSCDP